MTYTNLKVSKVNPKVTEKRIEIKEVFSLFDIPKVQKAIHLSKFAFRKPFPDRQINSIYFDDFSFSSFEDSIEGNCLRTKTRLRWYGNEHDEVSAVLELKKKQGMYSWKHLHQNKYRINTNARNWPTFINFLQKEESDLILTHLKPQSIVSYFRSYYASFDGKVRITIDQKLKTYQQTNLLRPNFTFHRKHCNIVVLEIKVSKKDSSLIREVCKDIPFNPQRFSKYCESLIPNKSF